MLGEAGATVYCTGRSVRGSPSPIGRPETIDETAELVNEAGGRGIAVRTDHSQAEQVEALFERVRADSGRLDVLVNDIGGEDLSDWKPLEQVDLEKGFALIDTAVNTHIITSRYGVPLMLERGSGLIVEITDGDHSGFRGTLFYDLAKNGAIRLAYAMGIELRKKGVTALAVTPGFLRSEAMLDGFGVTEESWRDAIPKAQGFGESETPCYVGRAVAALAADPDVHSKTAGVYASWTLAKEYGFRDVDGRQPDWGGYVVSSVNEILDRGIQDGAERFWVTTWYVQLGHDPRFAEMARRIEREVEL
jgi:NAD(P)-dependent dehydrogenase (short-subunit alcohol dehydrogenase family)